MSKRAFSLVELSVVVLIVTILVAGIFMGSGLIKNARVSNGRSHTAKSVARDINGLTAWYETSTQDSFNPGEVYDSALITQWRDISPSSNIGLTNQNVLETLASTNVVYAETGINDLPSIEFNGSGNLELETFYQGNSAQRTIFITFRPLAIASNTLLDSYSATTSSITIKDDDQITLDAGSQAHTATASDAANFSVSQDYIMAVYFDGGNSRAYLNNAQDKVGAGNINPGSNELTGLTVGSNTGSTSGFNGLISEIIIFNRLLKLQERKDVMSYLSTKYKISVSGL